MLKEFFLLFFLVFFAVPSFGVLSCIDRQDNCLSGEVKVLGISGLQNAHVEFPEQGNYEKVICCSDDSGGLSTDLSCSGSNGLFASLYSQTNSHVEFPANYYSQKLCLNSTNGTQFVCGFFSSPPSSGTCVYGLSGPQNAHVSACSGAGAYSNLVFCGTQVTANDVLEVKIENVRNKVTGVRTRVFSSSAEMEFDVVVFNRSSSSVSGVTLSSNISGAFGNVLESFNGSFDVAGGSSVVRTFSFNWSGQQNGSYQLYAGVPLQAGEESFFANNSDAVFVSVGENLGGFSGVSVPETNVFLVVLAVAAVVLVVSGFFSHRKPL